MCGKFVAYMLSVYGINYYTHTHKCGIMFLEITSCVNFDMIKIKLFLIFFSVSLGEIENKIKNRNQIMY